MFTKQFYGNDGTNWNKLSAGESLFPPGIILPYGGSAAPSGFLIADGIAYLRTDHPDLFDIIGTSFGDGTKNADGSSSGYAAGTAFNVPDMRGRFLRGVSGDSNLDPDKNNRTTMISGGGGNTNNSIGSVQGHMYQAHTHTTGAGIVYSGSGVWNFQAGSLGQTSVTGSAGGNETRPVNIYVNYIIKR